MSRFATLLLVGLLVAGCGDNTVETLTPSPGIDDLDAAVLQDFLGRVRVTSCGRAVSPDGYVAIEIDGEPPDLSGAAPGLHLVAWRDGEVVR